WGTRFPRRSPSRSGSCCGGGCGRRKRRAHWRREARSTDVGASEKSSLCRGERGGFGVDESDQGLNREVVVEHVGPEETGREERMVERDQVLAGVARPRIGADLQIAAVVIVLRALGGVEIVIAEERRVDAGRSGLPDVEERLMREQRQVRSGEVRL